MPTPDPLLESPADPSSLPDHASDSTSRVISFVLGFALASLVAWLGSISTEQTAVMRIEERVAAAVPPVVAAATAQKTLGATEEEAPTPPPEVAPVGSVQPQALRRQPPPEIKSYRGALALSSTPAGAQVLINGTIVGKTPVVLSDLPVGSRALVVRRAGYSSWSTSVRIVANQRTTVNATLVPAERTGG